MAKLRLITGYRAIENCNVLGRYGTGDLMPMRRVLKDGQPTFYDPSGLRIIPPDDWKAATPREIVEELNRQGAVPVATGRT